MLIFQFASREVKNNITIEVGFYPAIARNRQNRIQTICCIIEAGVDIQIVVSIDQFAFVRLCCNRFAGICCTEHRCQTLLTVQYQIIRGNAGCLNAFDCTVLESYRLITVLKTHNCTHRISLRQAGKDTSDSIIIPSPAALEFGELDFASVYIIQKTPQLCV